MKNELLTKEESIIDYRKNLWINKNNLFINYNGLTKKYDANKINKVFLEKKKSSSYLNFMLIFNAILIVSYFINFNWIFFILHIIIHLIAFSCMTQYDYFFVISLQNQVERIKIKHTDNLVFKAFLSDFHKTN
jgi:hypothetical protein